MKSMKAKVKEKEDAPTQKPKDDVIAISQEGMKKVFYERISEQVVERSKKHD